MEEGEASHRWAQKLYPQLMVPGVLGRLLSIGGSFVLVMDSSGRGQTSVWPVLGTRGRGEGSWKLLVSEDRLQVLLSVLKEPEVALSVGGGEG